VTPLPESKARKSKRSRAQLRSVGVHKESLLQIPLVAQMLNDPQTQFQERAVDNSWRYAEILRLPVTGFNPWSLKIMVAQNSRLNQWLKQPKLSARDLNDHDLLIHEVLMAVHDYLHIWAYLAIGDLLPQLRFGWGEITKKNLDDYVFCHLLTEAIAVVGLDYWQLCQGGVNNYCQVGTMTESLAVTYHEGLLPECRKFNPTFSVQEPAFFEYISRFYCSGEFLGFNVKDLKRSPVLLRWLEHELSYGELQRQYTRQWLIYLSKENIQMTEPQLQSSVAIDKPWKAKLIKDLGQMLWEKVKFSKIQKFRAPPEPRARWTRSRDKALDFRFVNLNELIRLGEYSEKIWETKNPHDPDYPYFVRQYLSRFDFASLDKDYSAMVGRLFANNDVAGLHAALKGQAKLRTSGPESIDLMSLT
jgi:hypothetical protein